MIEWHRTAAIRVVVAMALALALAPGCGGSGSTGLILPEAALLEQVRREGTCVEASSTTYCPTGAEGAVAPGGPRADGGELLLDTPGTPCPGEPEDDCAERLTAAFVVSGFEAGAACAAAARPAGDAGAWRTGALVAVDGVPARVTFPVPLDPGGPAVEITLLCFHAAPPALPPLLDALADARPDIVFVAREPALSQVTAE